MYKIAFLIPSNRPAKLKRFCRSIQHMSKLDGIAAYSLVYQEPVSELPEQITMSVQIKPFDQTKALPMVQLRRHGLQLIGNKAEYICFLDDDHQFVPERPGKKYPMSSEDFYLSSIKYMDENPDVGVMSLRGYFGGVAWGYEPKKNPKNGLIENNAGGILIRNIGIEKMFPQECWNFVGVMSEPLVGYNILSHGYNLAKRFNCPNKFEAPGATKHVGINSKISYSEEVCNQNVQGYIREKFNDPTWRHSNKDYPKGIKKILKIT